MSSQHPHASLRRYYLLFFIDVTTREVFFAGITANPTGPWTSIPNRLLEIAPLQRSLQDLRVVPLIASSNKSQRR